MKDITFGVFEDDADTVSYYLKSGTNISYKKYNEMAPFPKLFLLSLNIIVIFNKQEIFMELKQLEALWPSLITIAFQKPHVIFF